MIYCKTILKDLFFKKNITVKQCIYPLLSKGKTIESGTLL